jgi:hypothetical protein
VCGEQHAACGPAPDTTPVDERIEEVAAVGGPLKRYEVTTSPGVTTTMKLNDADAERLGVLNAPKQPTETEVPDRPAEPTETQTPQTKARTASRNKSRTAANKDGGAGGGDD